ncbi:hypothetical protein RFI_05420, partial [Reticulomyxa filosa]
KTETKKDVIRSLCASQSLQSNNFDNYCDYPNSIIAFSYLLIFLETIIFIYVGVTYPEKKKTFSFGKDKKNYNQHIFFVPPRGMESSWKCNHCNLRNAKSLPRCQACFNAKDNNQESLEQSENTVTQPLQKDDIKEEILQTDESNKKIHLKNRLITLDYDIIHLKKLNDKSCDPPMIFLHAFMDTKISWFCLLSKLSERWEGSLINISLRGMFIYLIFLFFKYCFYCYIKKGFGQSQQFDETPNEDNFALKEYVLDIIELLKHLHIESAIWVGHQMGSPTYKFPDDIVKNWNYKYFQNENQSFDIKNFIYETRHLDTLLNHNMIDKSFVTQYVSECIKYQSINTTTFVWKHLSTFDCKKQLSIIQCPCLIFFGRDDDIIPRQFILEVNKSIKKGMVTPFSNVGHYCHWMESLIPSINNINFHSSSSFNICQYFSFLQCILKGLFLNRSCHDKYCQAKSSSDCLHISAKDNKYFANNANWNEGPRVKEFDISVLYNFLYTFYFLLKKIAPLEFTKSVMYKSKSKN